MRPTARLLIPILLALSAGCVRRTLEIRSDPPGAIVSLNGMEVGSTPLRREFTWYGTYDVELRKPGYETLKTTGKVIAPWWQWIPIDLFAELFPLHDHRRLAYTLQPTSDADVDPAQMLDRAADLRRQLESSPYTRTPTTIPATKPVRATRPAP